MKRIKTDKFNNMISAFQCDFSLARDDEGHSLSELDNLIAKKNEKILKDIDLLEELEWLLRNGRAEIYLLEEETP